MTAPVIGYILAVVGALLIGALFAIYNVAVPFLAWIFVELLSRTAPGSPGEGRTVRPREWAIVAGFSFPRIAETLCVQIARHLRYSSKTYRKYLKESTCDEHGATFWFDWESYSRDNQIMGVTPEVSGARDYRSGEE